MVGKGKSKKPSSQYLKRKADKLLSAIVRSRGECEMCGKSKLPAQLQCAHVITRSLLHLRYDPKNVMALCNGCHLKWHHDVLQSITWFNGVYPERAKYLLEEKNKLRKPDYETIIRRLENETRSNKSR